MVGCAVGCRGSVFGSFFGCFFGAFFGSVFMFFWGTYSRKSAGGDRQDRCFSDFVAPYCTTQRASSSGETALCRERVLCSNPITWKTSRRLVMPTLGDAIEVELQHGDHAQ